MLKRLFFSVLLFLLMFSSISQAGTVEELVYGNWAVYASDGPSSYHWNQNNLEIEHVFDFDPLAETSLRVRLNNQQKAYIFIRYSPQKNLYFMKISKLRSGVGGVWSVVNDGEDSVLYVKIYSNTADHSGWSK